MITITTMAQTKIYLVVGEMSMVATLSETDASRELLTLLSAGPVEVEMSDYGGFEKVGALPESLTVSDSRITTVPGDIMLYQGHNIVIFYGSNTWSYTPLGRIDGATADGVRDFLGNGNVMVTLTLDPEAVSGVCDVMPDKVGSQSVYDVNGIPVKDRPLRSGVYIIDGKKTKI